VLTAYQEMVWEAIGATVVRYNYYSLDESIRDVALQWSRGPESLQPLRFCGSLSVEREGVHSDEDCNSEGSPGVRRGVGFL